MCSRRPSTASVYSHQESTESTDSFLGGFRMDSGWIPDSLNSVGSPTFQFHLNSKWFPWFPEGIPKRFSTGKRQQRRDLPQGIP